MIKRGGHIFFSKFSRVQRFVGFFLDCAFWVLIGWAGMIWLHGNLDKLFLGIGFSYLVNEIKFMLISSRYFRIRSKKRLKFVSSKSLSYQHLPTTADTRYTKNGGEKTWCIGGIWTTLVPEVFFRREKNIKRQSKKQREKTSGYPRCESHYHATIAINQHHEID